MGEASSDPAEHARAAARRPVGPRTYAALDLGTNNCRLLIATRAGEGFRIVDSFSRIVRLGEGLSQSGRLSDAAMERALAALGLCADKIARRRAFQVKAVATHACRFADNAGEFIDRVAECTGLRLAVISPREEARLSVAGCENLLDHDADAALVLDVGGGSTELSWLDLRRPARGARSSGATHQGVAISAWLSIPIGVVTLAERFPEGIAPRADWYRNMVEAVKREIAASSQAEALRPIFAAGRAYLIGTSGAITSLAGLHLGLARYDRNQVDGLWMTRGQCEATALRLGALTAAERADQPCIGADRADLVLAGAAILQAVQELWPCERVRVADRGLREGLLLSMMSPSRRARGPRRFARNGASR